MLCGPFLVRELAMWDEPIVKLKCLNISLIETIKGVDPYWQQDGGHGSWYPLKKCVTTYLPNELALKIDDAKAFYLNLTVKLYIYLKKKDLTSR